MDNDDLMDNVSVDVSALSGKVKKYMYKRLEVENSYILGIFRVMHADRQN